MNSVFVLQHVRDRDDGSEDVKFIGVYSSRAKAEAAIGRLSNKPGFAETVAGFCIDKYELDLDHWREGFGVEWSDPQE